MGEGFLQFYQTKLKKESKIAFFSTLVIGLLVHLYKFVNTLPNHDSLYNYYSDQNVLGSGRWALSWACGISSYYDLPWVIGLLSCIFIALTAVVVVAVFRMKNPVLIGLTGGLLAASPAITQTFFFLYTADGYMIAMFLAALAVYLTRIEENRWLRWTLAGICICVCCGIYQAYVSFSLVLAVCYLIDDLLQNNHTKDQCLKWILKQAILYIAALAAYYVIWQLCMYVTHITPTDYQGINEVGKISINTLFNGLKHSIKSTLFYFTQWNVLKYGWTPYSVLGIVFLFCTVVGLGIAVVNSGILKRTWAAVLLVLCLIAIIPFACMWYFTSDAVDYRTMMLQSLMLVFVLTALLYERWAKPLAKNAVALLLLLILFSNALIANISYFYMHLCYERTYAEGLQMMLRIQEFQEDYTFTKIAGVGSRELAVQYHDVDSQAWKIGILNGNIDKTLLYDSGHTTRFLQATFGMDLETLVRGERDKFAVLPEVQSMGCWPARDSMAVIGDTLIIKFSD